MYIRALFKQEARRALAGQHTNALLVAVIALIIPFIFCCAVFSPALLAIALVMMGPLLFAISRYFLMVTSKKPPTINDFFGGFDRALPACLAYLWQCLWTLLWLCAFIVPGIIKSLSYRMQLFLLADEPQLDARRALELSKRLTEGYKWELFVTDLSFIGWALLSLATGGLALVYVLPYYYTTMAVIYRYLKEQALIDGRLTMADLPSAKRKIKKQPPTSSNDTHEHDASSAITEDVVTNIANVAPPVTTSEEILPTNTADDLAISHDMPTDIEDLPIAAPPDASTEISVAHLTPLTDPVEEEEHHEQQ